MIIFPRTGGHPEWEVFSVSSLCTRGEMSYQHFCLYFPISLTCIFIIYLPVFPHIFCLYFLIYFACISSYILPVFPYVLLSRIPASTSYASTGDQGLKMASWYWWWWWWWRSQSWWWLWLQSLRWRWRWWW